MVEILKLKLNRDSGIVIGSRFVNCELSSCDMNSTLGSVLPLAMFENQSCRRVGKAGGIALYFTVLNCFGLFANFRQMSAESEKEATNLWPKFTIFFLF